VSAMAGRLLHFRRPAAEDAAMLLDWRTDPEIARNMFSEVGYDLDRQRAWLESVSARADYSHFLILTEGTPIGYLSYSAIDRRNLHCVPGFYVGAREHRARAAGYLHWFIMTYAFERLGMNKVVSQIMDCNPRMVRSLRLLKMEEVGVHRRHVLKSDGWHDVHLFELHREVWERQPQPFPRDEILAAFEE